MSPMNARNGCMVMLMDESMTHNMPAAIQRPGEFGMINSASDDKIAPARK